MMQFINTKRPTKLGGQYGYINKAIEFLKNELKSEYKKQKL